MQALDREADWDLFDPAMKAALVYAERMNRDAHRVTDPVFAEMKVLLEGQAAA